MYQFIVNSLAAMIGLSVLHWFGLDLGVNDYWFLLIVLQTQSIINAINAKKAR